MELLGAVYEAGSNPSRSRKERRGLPVLKLQRTFLEAGLDTAVDPLRTIGESVRFYTTDSNHVEKA